MSKTKLKYVGSLGGYLLFLGKVRIRTRADRFRAMAIPENNSSVKIYFSGRYDRTQRVCIICVDNFLQLDDQSQQDAVRILGPWLNDRTFAARSVEVRTWDH